MQKSLMIALIIFGQVNSIYNASAQITKQYGNSQVQTLSHNDEDGAYVGVFDVFADGTIDTSRSLQTMQMLHRFILQKQMKERNRLHSKDTTSQPAYPDSTYPVFKKYLPRTDTALFYINKGILKDSNDFYWYRVWKDNTLLYDWRRADFSDNNRIAGNNYKLLKANFQFAHKYIIEINDHLAKPCLRLDMSGSSTIMLWGIYRNVQIPEVKKALSTVKNIDYTSIGLLPASYCISGSNEKLADGIVLKKDDIDTFKIKDHFYYIPRSVTVLADDDLLFLLGTIPDSVHYEYFVTGYPIDSSMKSWKALPAGDNLMELKKLKPGNYELHIRFNNDTVNTLEYRFAVGTPPKLSQTKWFNWVLGSLASGLSFLLMFIAYRRVQKGAAREREEKLKMTSMQLQVYRSQLNPHFIFNALSSIQSLVNKNDNNRANQYLTDFSSLLRMTLDQQKAEFWTLQEEVELLQKYISLEQLRFRFQYDLQIDTILIASDISFPSMLLQPIVENAIKHGISANYESGKLVISFIGKKNDLEIIVSDNGQGFDTEQPIKENHGIYLTKERISFINELNKTQHIRMDIKCSSTGTEVRFYFQNFLNN